MKTQRVQIYSGDIEAIAKATAEHLHSLQDKVLTLEQTAELLGKSKEAVKKLCQRKKIPFHRLNITLYFSEREVTKYLLGM